MRPWQLHVQLRVGLRIHGLRHLLGHLGRLRVLRLWNPGLTKQRSRRRLHLLRPPLVHPLLRRLRSLPRHILLLCTPWRPLLCCAHLCLHPLLLLEELRLLQLLLLLLLLKELCLLLLLLLEGLRFLLLLLLLKCLRLLLLLLLLKSLRLLLEQLNLRHRGRLHLSLRALVGRLEK